MSDIPNVSRQFWHIAAFHWEESIYEALGNNLPNGSDHNIKSSSLTYMKKWSDSNRTICLRKSPQLHWCKTLRQDMYNLTWFFVFKFFLHKWINSICMEVKTILMFPKNIWESLPHTPMLAKKGVKFPFHTHTLTGKKKNSEVLMTFSSVFSVSDI